MSHDNELLRRFAEDGSQEAFAEFVRLKVNLVFTAALRQTAGDAHLAQDVTQGVFAAAAGQAEGLAGHAALSGWLFTTTRFLAIRALRRQRRWQRREQEALAMNELSRGSEPRWNELRPVIDEALHALGAKDREALLLRYFEGLSLHEVGAAVGLAENAARMRVDRALEKLRAQLARRGVTSTAAALGGTLAAQPVVALPAGLVASATVAGLTGAAWGGTGALAGAGSAVIFMSAGKLTAMAVVLVAAGALGGYWIAQPRAEASRVSANPVAVSGIPARPAGGSASRSGPPLDTTAAAGGRNGVTPVASGASSGRPSALDALRVLMDLHRRKLVTPTVHLITASPTGVQLTAEFVELFGLTAREQAALQSGIDTMRARMNELARENVGITRAPNGDVKLELKPFPEAGGAAYDAMITTFAATLGTERSNAVLALVGEEMEKELGRFGTTHGSMTVSREVSVDGQVHYRIRSLYSDTPENKASYTSDRLTREQFVQEVGAFVELLPPDFLTRK